MELDKRFDCVKMKNDIQARLRKRRAKMSPEQAAEDIRQAVLSSDAPVAQLWRRLSGLAGQAGRTQPARQ